MMNYWFGNGVVGGGFGWMWLMMAVWTVVGILLVVWLWKQITRK